MRTTAFVVVLSMVLLSTVALADVPGSINHQGTLTHNNGTSIVSTTVNLDSGLVAYYPFNGNANDFSGNGHHGTPFGVLPTTDRYGSDSSAYYFDGVDDYIDISSLDLSSSSRGSIAAWFKTDVLFYPPERDILNYYHNGNNRARLFINTDADDKLYFILWDVGRKIEINSDQAIAVDEWYHVVIIQSGTTSRMYLNGAPQADTDSGEWFDDVGEPDTAFHVGNSPWLATDWEGKIDELRFYNRVLTEAEIATLMKTPPHLTVNYPNGGETIVDSVTISWTATDPDPGDSTLLLIDLDYSPDSGTTWTPIDSNQVNDGAYFWDITGQYVYGSPNCLIRITATDTVDLSDSDLSDSVFTIDNPIPRIVSISDVPNDQGKQVLILWDRSYLDAPEYQVITYYSIWRRHLGGSKIMLIGDEWDGSPPKDLSKLVYRCIERENGADETKIEYWEYLGSVDAHFFEGYAYIAPTLEDSSASGVPYFTFLVSAQTADPFVFWDSAPDSGYSVDNINPAKTQITAIASGSAKGLVNTIWLTWDQVTTGVDGSLEQGPIQYRIYCDEAPDFTPAPGNLLTTTSDLSYPHTDSRIGDPAANLFYLVTAVDGSDNESVISNMVGEFDRSLTNSK